MTKLEIINEVSEKIGLPRNISEKAVEAIIGLIKETLQKGEPVILRKFGSFHVKDKKERIGRNPKTGEEATISARRVVRFKSGKYFKQIVDAGHSSQD
jgi:nucleoid DNA-binding protein